MWRQNASSSPACHWSKSDPPLFLGFLRGVPFTWTFHMLSSMILLVSDFLWSKPSPLFLLIPVVMLFQVMFSVGICWMLSLVALLVRDLAQLIYFITMMLLIITPIAYTPDMIPDGMKVLMLFNPLYYFVTCFQYIIILDQMPPMDTLLTGIVISIVFFTLGFSVFHRSKQVFYDFA